jgi:glucosylceramidase
MKMANETAKNKPVKFFGSSWSGPAWLKTNEKLFGKGTLKEGTGSKTWKTYANYLLKYKNFLILQNGLKFLLS